MRTLISAIGIAAVCQVAASVQTSPGGIDGRVSDSDGAMMPGVTVSVSSPALPAGRTIISNPRGRFDLTQVAAGEYALSLSLPGFRTARGVVSVKPGTTSAVTFQMEVGTLQEQVTVRSPGPVQSIAPKPLAGPGGPVRVGGSIQEPRKTVHVTPSYPIEAQAAGAEGDIRIEAVITQDGSVARARVVQGVPLLNAAALEAVRQWRYTPTRLNGAPIEVITNVTISFVR